MGDLPVIMMTTAVAGTLCTGIRIGRILLARGSISGRHPTIGQAIKGTLERQPGYLDTGDVYGQETNWGTFMKMVPLGKMAHLSCVTRNGVRLSSQTLFHLLLDRLIRKRATPAS